MPRKRITFIVIPPNDGHVQEYKLASHLLWIGSLLALLFVCALGYYSLQFLTRVDQSRKIVDLRSQNEQLERSLEGARRDLSQFEGQMDQLAHRLGISPIDIRLINTLKPGLPTGTGQVMDEGCGIEATVLRIKEYMESQDLRFARS